MCGRYASARSVADLAAAFGIADDDVDVADAPDWNVAPTKPIVAVLVRDGRRVLTALRWGLVPPWAADPSIGARMINARIETVAEKPAFSDALPTRRCLLPADGWYEWARRPDGARQPHYVSPPDGRVLALAGLWQVWRDAGGDRLLSAAILTGPAPEDLAWLHDRAPVAVTGDDRDAWLDPTTSLDEVRHLLRPTEMGLVAAWPVGPEVGDVRANHPGLTAPVRLDEQQPLF